MGLGRQPTLHYTAIFEATLILEDIKNNDRDLARMRKF